MYKKKQPSPSEAIRKRERISMREGCNAMMEVVRDSDHWVVSKLEKAHNHSLGTCSRVGYLRARGLLDASDKITVIGSDDNSNNHHDDSCESITSRYNVLCTDAIRCAEKGSGSKAVYKAAKDILHKAYEEIIAYERNPGRGLHRDAININEDITIDDATNDQSLPDSGRKDQQQQYGLKHGEYLMKRSDEPDNVGATLLASIHP
ncbi:hypothetical protein ABZP36_033663 [Zizania latifolia]